MNRKDWERQVFASDLNPTARLVALALGSFGNWTEDRTVWPSTKAIADMTGMHRDTAQRYVDALTEQGWLAVVKVRPGNIREHELCKAVASPSGILAKAKRKNNLPDAQASSCLTDNEQLPDAVAAVASTSGTNIKEPTIREPKELLDTTADAAVPTSLNDSLGGGVGMDYFLNTVVTPPFSKHIKTPRPVGFGTGPSWTEQASQIPEEW